MNQKRSRNSHKSSLHWENNKKRGSAVQLSEPSSDIHQITPLHQPLWFWNLHSGWSYFSRGLFWGGLVSLTAVFSAFGGVALTNISVVEQQISRQLKGNSKPTVSAEYKKLTTPLQILLVEVEPDADALIGFSKTARGESKNILLLEVEPERNSARAFSIPGNSQVQIPEFGKGTVTDAYRLGGIDLLSQSIDRLDNIAVNRYLRTSPEVFEQLTDSGKINLPQCDSRLGNCLNIADRLVRQETVFKTIRQRLNIPGYWSSFKTAIAQAEPQLDTNISMPELIAVMNFIKELEPDRLTVTLLPEYTPVEAKNDLNRLVTNPSRQIIGSGVDSKLDLGKEHLFESKPIAVQNTTDDPELGRRVVAYLRQQNFRDVYLVRHMPLKLEQTQIVTNYSQVETANYLKNILGFGNLEAELTQQQQLVLQLGEDALNLPRSRSSL